MTKNEIMNSFVDLTFKLSPENLTCDGELSKRQVKTKLRKLKAEWKRLEKQLGKSMSESEVWAWYMQNKNNPSGKK